MKKTLVTIDFDGVVSPIDSTRTFEESEGWRTFRFSGFNCAIHQTVIDFLHYLENLSKTGLVTVYWNSTWNEGTEDFFPKSAGEVPNFPWLHTQPGKAVVALSKVEEGNFKRLVFLEDSSVVTRTAKRSIKSKSDVAALFIQPKVTKGLTESHISKIQEFLGQ